MQIQINSDHRITASPKLAGRVQALVRDTLERYSDRITRVEVHLNDLNGVKAGRTSAVSEDTYQILSLDREKLKLYQGNRYVLDEIVLAPSVPRTIEEALGERVSLPGVDRRGSFSPGPGGQANMVRHGHGSKADEVGLDIERFIAAAGARAGTASGLRHSDRELHR